MGRIVQDAKLGKREQRLRLEQRRKPYWLTLNEGEHLGYYRGARVGKWVARYRRAGSGVGYKEITLGEADDTADADGTVILDFRQAQELARKWFTSIEGDGHKRGRPVTVGDALDAYLASFAGKDVINTRGRIEGFIRPHFASVDLAKLTTNQISDWHKSLAASPARLRSKIGGKQNVRTTADNEDARRRRRSSANRIMTVLKAALNKAFIDGHVASDGAWRRVKPFPKADAPKLRYLKDDEARRLVNAVDLSIRPLVQAALLTGARYSELGRLEARDFDLQSRTVILRETKGGEIRHLFLDPEGFSLFEAATAGKSAKSLVFPRPDGKRWGSSQQARPMRAACAVAQLEPTGFHDLRRTYGARLALKGVPMAVIAKAMGHKDERITSRHYAHLCQSYVADTIRGAVSGLGVIEGSNLVSIAGATRS